MRRSLPVQTPRQASKHCRHSGDVPVVFGGTVGVAENDLIEASGVEVRMPREEARDHVCSEVVWPDFGESLAETNGVRVASQTKLPVTASP